MNEAQMVPVRVRDAAGGEHLSVRGLEAKVSVDGPLARSEISVTFTNDLGRAIEGDLVVPLPASAALSALSVRCGTRTIVGAVRARARAQSDYVRAREAGRTAAIGESEGQDLARLRVAPIAPGEDVVVRLVLQHLLTPTAEGERLVLPLTYMPRFVEDDAALGEIERAALERPRPLTLAARASVTVVIAGEARVRVASHAGARVEKLLGRSEVALSGVPLDRDLHVDVLDRPETGKEPAVWIRHDPSEGPDGQGPATAIAIVPPAFAEEGETVPRTVTFLVDRSGSMSNGPMQAAIRAVRGALRALGPSDLFNVIAFDDRLEALARRPMPFDAAALAAADRFASALTARGGTQAQRAIAAALHDEQRDADAVLAPPKAKELHRLRVVVFMTDGDVAGAEGVLKTARAELVDTRIHVVGIGDAVNHAMLAEIARLGGGTYTPVATDEDLERAIARLKVAMSAPVWTGIRAHIASRGDRRSPDRMKPDRVVDLFAGEPVLLAWRGAIARGDRLVLTGERAGGRELSLDVPLDDALPRGTEDEARAKVAPLVWALLESRRLTYRFDPSDDATLEALGVAHGLVNRATAIVGVDPDTRDVVAEGRVAVSLPLPRNAAEAEMTRAGGMPRMMLAGMPAPQAFAACRAPTGAPPPPAPAAFMPPRSFDAGEALAALEECPPAEKRRAHAGGASDESALRALLLRQGADGLFDGSLAVTLAAVAALVASGHTAREGAYRAELRRTLATARARLPRAAAEEKIQLALLVALLTLAPTPELPPEIGQALEGVTTSDLHTLPAAVRAALAAAPPAWRASAAAASIAARFALG